MACGETIISGPAGGTVRLHVPEDSVLDLTTQGVVDRWRNAEAQGTGPLVGFVLTDNTRDSDGGLFVFGHHFASGYYTLVQDQSVSNVEIDEATYGRHLIPAGDYSLYLVASSGTVSVTLPFEGRPGTVSVATTRTVAARVEGLANRIPDPAGTNQWNVGSMGEAAALEEAGFIALSVAAPPTLGPGAGEICFYHGIPSNQDTAYMPGCPASYLDDFQGFEFFPWPGEQFIIYESDGGDRAAGIWWTVSNPTFRASAVAVFVPYEAAALADEPVGSQAAPPGPDSPGLLVARPAPDALSP